MRRSIPLWLSLLLAASVAATADGGRGHGPHTIIAIGGFSTQASPNHAVAGAQIAAETTRARETERDAPVVEASGSDAPEEQLPTLRADSPLLRDPSPLGPETLWYQAPPGQQCIYVPSSSGLCFIVVGPNGARLDPALVAAQMSRTMNLELAPIEASPSASRSGLTGDRSWFWLATAATRRQVTVTLGAETVTVTAEPSAVAWQFGDGRGSPGGPGVAYRPGPPPAGAITHVYETRCLPGDAGRNPYVSSLCESDGYRVLARVTWTISFVVSGPAAASGTLPARTTESELVYPVGEARAFLVGGSS